MIISLALGRFLPTASDTSGFIAPPPAVAQVTGGVAAGYAQVGEILTGIVTGGVPDQIVMHRWMADGAEIAGEVEATLQVPAGAGVVVYYAPLVDGVERLSSPVQVVDAAQAGLTGDIAGEVLPEQTLNGSILGGYPGQLVQHRWLADGAEIAGEVAPTLILQPEGNVPAGTMLRYAPLVGGVELLSATVQLVALPQAQVAGDTGGLVLPEQPLNGLVEGGLSSQVVEPRWTANDTLLPSETDTALIPRPGDNVPSAALICYTPLVDGQMVVSPPVQLVDTPQAQVTGDTGGLVLEGATLTGTVIGGLPDQVITHRWLADGTEIAGADTATLIAQIGPDVPPQAALRYAPLLDGIETVSSAVQLAPAVEVSVTGDTSGEVLPGQTLTGAITGGLPGQVVQHRWLADGIEIAGEAAPVLTLQLGGPIAEGAELSYAPIIAGMAFATAQIELVAPARATVSGDASGLVLQGQTLIGDVLEGLSSQSVTHRWLADGAEIVGEDEASLLVSSTAGMAADAVLRYAPLVDGVELQSDPVQLVMGAAASVAGDTGGYLLPGQTLTGAVMGGLPGQVVVHRWLADGAEIAGESAISLTAQPGVNMPAEATLRYAPLVDGVEVASGVVQLVAAVAVSISGDASGVIEAEQTLTGMVSGGLPGQTVTHRWLANGTEITGEAGASLTPDPAANVPAEAALRYAPLVDGVEYLSRVIQLAAVAPPLQAQSLPRLVGPQRMGAEITLDSAMLSGVSARTYYLDGVEIQGATGPSVIAMGMGVLTCEVVANEGTFTTPGLRILHNHEMASHNLADDGALALLDHGAASHIAAANGDWSDPSIWDLGEVPGEGATILIPDGASVRYDMASAPRLDRLRIDGTLTWALERSTNMLVETIVVPPHGHMVIGDAVENRLPAQLTAEITISNRAYRLDATAPSDLDLAGDPQLLGRGLLVLGGLTVFGHHRAHAVETAPGQLPLAGQTSVTLAEPPENWAVGDTIVIPGTAVDLDDAGVNTRYDEERVITQIDGAAVFFAEPLIHTHDHHNPTVTDRPDLALPIVVKDRNVIIRSEAGAEVHQRGHVMCMHKMARVDIWDMAFVELGRTDKSRPTGVIDENGDFKFIEAGTKTVSVTPLTADANLQSRYPIHGHFLGFKKQVTDLVRDCFIEDAKGWAGVHHGCEMDWLANVFYRYQGSGLVAETQNELGRWDRNVTLGLETVTGSYRFPKGQEEKEGKTGDFGKWGYGYYYRGRAMIVTRNVAIGATWGHVFYHRGSANGIGDGIDLLRENVDVNDLGLLSQENAVIDGPDYPITHFDRNASIGCSGAFAVVKTAAAQGHDLNIKIANFLGWGVGRGIGLNYIGGYLVQDTDVIRSRFDSQVTYSTSSQSCGYTTGKTNQVAFDRVKARDFFIGVEFTGSDVQGISNSLFSQNDPRFIMANYEFTDCGADWVFNGGSETPTEQIVRFKSLPIDYMDNPVIDLPFIIADYSGTQGVGSFTDVQVAVKTDSVSDGGLMPKPWDNMGLSIGTQTFRTVRLYAEKFGVWDYEGDKIILVPYYFSDRLTANSIKQMHAFRFTGDVTKYVDNGSWTRSATGPVCDDVTRTVTQGETDSFNVLTGASGAPGTTLSLNIPEIAAGLGTDNPAHFKANYGKINVTAEGQVDYTPVPGFVGNDTMLVYVYDGQGRFCTVRITYEVQAQ